MATYGQVCKDGHIMNHSTNTEYISGDNNYCSTCGSKGITQCPSCEDKKIKVTDEILSNDDSVHRSQLPLYCGNCGEEFPWVGELDSVRREREFVSPEVAEDEYYRSLINELNRAYQMSGNTSTLILVRKCIESALVEIIYNKYGKDKVQMYFDPGSCRFKSLSELVSEFDECLDDFSHYPAYTEQDIISKINKIKQQGDNEAHQIRTYKNQEEMNEYSEDSEWVITNLLELKRQTANE